MTAGTRPAVRWPWFVAVIVSATASILLSAQALSALTAFHQRTARLCDGTLPLPAGSFVYAWSGVATAVATAIGMAVLARTFRQRRPVTVAIVTIMTLGLLLSAAWTAWDVHRDAKPITRVCGG